MNSLSKNPRLIPVDKKEVAHFTEILAVGLRNSARTYLQLGRDWENLENVPIGAFKKWKSMFGISGLPSFAPDGWSDKNLRIEAKTFRGRKNLTVRFVPQALSKKVAQEILKDPDSYICETEITGGALILEESMGHEGRKLTVPSAIQINLCPLLTLNDLANMPVSFLPAADPTGEFLRDLYSLLLHELTHAMEFGAPKNYSLPDSEGAREMYEGSTTGSFGSKKDYLNHPWEVRAKSREIGDSIVKWWQTVNRRRYRLPKEYKTRQQIPSPQEVINEHLEVGFDLTDVFKLGLVDNVQSVLDLGFTLDDILESLRWGELGFPKKDAERFSKHFEQYSEKNRRLMYQYIVRLLQDEQLIN